MVPSWRDGVTLSASQGVRFGTIIPLGTTSQLCTSVTPNHYYFRYVTDYFLNNLGNLYNAGYVFTIQYYTGLVGGFLCKKYRTAPTPPKIGYNIGTCFPSLPANGGCPSGWYALIFV